MKTEQEKEVQKMERNTILQGDAWQLAKTLPDSSINCIVTSPPYFGLRSYLPNEHEDKHTEFGCEDTPEEYVDKLVALFRELRRALRHDGTVWLNLGDSYAGSWGNYGGQNRGHGKQREIVTGSQVDHPAYAGLENWRPPTAAVAGLKPKDLIGIPWRAAFALQADGWWLRSEIIWHKRAPMPESVSDRPTKSHEYVFLLTKSPRYFYDADAIREPLARDYSQEGWANVVGKQGNKINSGVMQHNGDKTWAECMNPLGRNKRSVWTLGPEPQKAAHFAVMPSKLVEPCILAGCPHRVCAECGAPWVRVVERGEIERHPRAKNYQPARMAATAAGQGTNGLGKSSLAMARKIEHLGFAPTCACNGDTRPGVTLDPFMGAGTVAKVCVELGRHYIGFELNSEYVKLAEQRIARTQPALFGAI